MLERFTLELRYAANVCWRNPWVGSDIFHATAFARSHLPNTHFSREFEFRICVIPSGTCVWVCVRVRVRVHMYTTVNMLELKIGLPVQHRNLDVLCSQRANTRLFLLQFCVCGFYSLTFTKSPVHAATQKHSTHVLDSIRWTTLHFPYIHCKVFSVQIGTVIPREWGMWTSGGLLSCVWSLFVWATIEQDKHFKNYIDFWFGA